MKCGSLREDHVGHSQALPRSARIIVREDSGFGVEEIMPGGRANRSSRHSFYKAQKARREPVAEAMRA